MIMVKNLTTLVIGFAVFIFWISLVGNPQVIETVLGLFIAIAAAVYIRRAVLNKLFRD